MGMLARLDKQFLPALIEMGIFSCSSTKLTSLVNVVGEEFCFTTVYAFNKFSSSYLS